MEKIIMRGSDGSFNIFGESLDNLSICNYGRALCSYEGIQAIQEEKRQEAIRQTQLRIEAEREERKSHRLEIRRKARAERKAYIKEYGESPTQRKKRLQEEIDNLGDLFD